MVGLEIPEMGIITYNKKVKHLKNGKYLNFVDFLKLTYICIHAAGCDSTDHPWFLLSEDKYILDSLQDTVGPGVGENKP